ncbi:MAG TPA: hypothetical protein VJ821_14715 [Anaerolineales bacterium]|nr:hypothetical protein [Anaerolineales bacterium]
MGPIYRSLAAYEPLIYIALAIWSLFVFRSMYRSWREWQDSVYSLEREFALTRLVRSTAIALLVLGLVFAEFFIATFVAPALPASDILATPTLNLLASPAGTISPELATQNALSPVLSPVPSGSSGCIPDQLIITAPAPGDEVNGTVQLVGTAAIPNFGFYKYEVTPLGIESWATISAGRDPKRNEELGDWDTTTLANGDYFLRLVVTDNVGVSLEPCVIAIRILNP